MTTMNVERTATGYWLRQDITEQQFNGLTEQKERMNFEHQKHIYWL